MVEVSSPSLESCPDPRQDLASKAISGFWVYLMTDCILFATLFATYLVLSPNVYGGPSSKDLFTLHAPLAETLILLTSSFTCGLGVLAAKHQQKRRTFVWLVIAFLLGASFLAIELTEFSDFIAQGYGWQRSAFLSSYFTLVGTHGLHITVGLTWLTVLLVQILICDIQPTTFRRLACFSMFWHFLDVVWIFIFTLVYLMGVK